MKTKNFTALLFCIIVTSCLLQSQEVDSIRKPELILSVNLLGVGTLNPNIDIDYSLNNHFSLGATVWYEFRNIEDRWFQCRLSYYPGKQTMKGPAFSATLGYHEAFRTDKASSEIDKQDGAFTIGTLASYTWRFGANKRICLTPVIGIKKTLQDNYTNSPLESVLAEGRLNLGFII